MKGHTNNPNGRPKGTPNKATRRVKAVLMDIFDTEYTPDKIREYMADLDHTDKLRFFVQVLPYLAPKHRPEDDRPIDAPNFNSIDLSTLSDDELTVLETLQKKVEQPTTEITRIIIDPISPKNEDTKH
jgi:hypothetical protein